MRPKRVLLSVAIGYHQDCNLDAISGFKGVMSGVPVWGEVNPSTHVWDVFLSEG